MIYIFSFIWTMVIIKLVPKNLLNYKINIKLFNHKEYNFTFSKFFIIMFFPLILEVFRYGIGTDYNSYLGFFRLQSNLSPFKTSYTGIELGFRIFTKLFAYISDNQIIFFGFFTFFSMYFYFALGIKIKSEIYLPYYVLFYLCLIYGESFNIIRQSIALSICAFAIYYFLNNQLRQYIIFVLFASTFHISAVIMLPFYFIKYITFGKLKKILKFMFVVFCIYCITNYSNIIYILGGIYAKYRNHLGGTEIYYSAVLYFFEKIILILPLLLNRNKIDQKYLKIFYVIFVDLLLVIPSLKIEYFYRISYYFWPFYGVIIACFLNNNVNKKFYKLYYGIVFLGIFWLQYIYFGNHGIYPYKCIFML